MVGREDRAGGIEAETRQALDNIRAVLERHGSSMDRVIKCTAMLADMEEWPAMNRVYAEHFPRISRRAVPSAPRPSPWADGSKSNASRRPASEKGLTAASRTRSNTITPGVFVFRIGDGVVEE